METVRLTAEIHTTGKPEMIEQIVARELDHQFRGQFTLLREDGTAVFFDPVLADGEAPPGYRPHAMETVDHRVVRQTRPDGTPTPSYVMPEKETP